MDVGFGLPVSGAWATPQTMLKVARRAEQLGYHALWTFQRLLCDPAGRWGEVYRSVHDPLIALAHVGAVTERIRLGVAVINMPFITPVLLAKQVATLDILSAGRVDLGLGLGWADEEYVASGVTKKNLGRRADDFVATLRALWTDDVVSHDGEFYRIPPASFAPRPVQQPTPPILFGGAAPGALKRAGRLADGWISSSRADLHTIEDAIKTVRAAATAAGRDPGQLRMICRATVRLRPPAPAAPERALLSGTPDQVRADIAKLGEAGVTELIVDLNFDPLVGSPTADPGVALHQAELALESFADLATSTR